MMTPRTPALLPDPRCVARFDHDANVTMRDGLTDLTAAGVPQAMLEAYVTERTLLMLKLIAGYAHIIIVNVDTVDGELRITK